MNSMKYVKKMADLDGFTAAKLFDQINGGLVKFVIDKDGFYGSDDSFVLVTDSDPNELTYPEGWYFAKGVYRNKHNSTTGCYSEVPMFKSTGERW
jgi:hypothetical protein